MIEIDRLTLEKIICKLESEGKLFPEFELVKTECEPVLLGSGSFSLVYEMQAKNAMSKRYALKVIGASSQTISSEKFREIVYIQRKLADESPFVVRIIDIREINVWLNGKNEYLRSAIFTQTADEGDLHLQFILMEKLENLVSRAKNGKIRLARKELENEEEVIRFAFEIGQVLKVIHKNSILHRDIKLENIFWDNVEQCYKLGDFGLAKCIEGNSAETIIFTDGYGAPEIEMALSNYYDMTADIYSFGVTLFLLLNELKFPASNGYYVNQVQYTPGFVFPVPEKASEKLALIINRMCAYERKERYQNLSDILKDLEKCENGFEDESREEEFFGETECETLVIDDMETEQAVEAYKPDLTDYTSNAGYDKSLEANYLNESAAGEVLFCLGFIASMFFLFAGYCPVMEVKENISAFIILILYVVFISFRNIRPLYITSGILVLVALELIILQEDFRISYLFMMFAVFAKSKKTQIYMLISFGLWSVGTFFGGFSWLDWAFQKNLVWIFLSVGLIFAERNLNRNIRAEIISKEKGEFFTALYIWGLIGMIIAGIVFFILKKTGVCVIPLPIMKLKPAIAGGIAFFCEILHMSIDKALDEEKEGGDI